MTTTTPTTVSMFFPHRVDLTDQQRITRRYPAGVNEVPVSLVNHFWLKVNGVTLYQPEEKP